jgi:divinyl chlorophyllide a 8-vinyl-reductase
MTYTIVRPTAFFKSVSGQLESIQNGAPYVLFGDGAVTQCNPIAGEDLAYYMMDSAINDDKRNKILNIGGPDAPLTNQMLGGVSDSCQY